MSNSLNHLQREAQAVFKSNPNAKDVFATEDGNFYLPHRESFAKLHAKQTKGEVHRISREEAEAATEQPEPKAKKAKVQTPEPTAPEAAAAPEPQTQEPTAPEAAATEAPAKTRKPRATKSNS